MGKLDLTQYVAPTALSRMKPAFTTKSTCLISINSAEDNAKSLAEQYTEYLLHMGKKIHKTKVSNNPDGKEYYYTQRIISLPTMFNAFERNELRHVLEYPLVSFGIVLDIPSPPIYSPNGRKLVPEGYRGIPSGEIYLSYTLEHKEHIDATISNWIVKLQHPEEFHNEEDPTPSWHQDTFSASILMVVYNEKPTLENIKTSIQDVLLITRMFPIDKPYESLV